MSDSHLTRVWLPSIGQVGFVVDDAIESRDWLVPPPVQGDWQSPPEVWSPPTRLTELTLLHAPSTETFLHDLQQEIGTPPRSLADTDESGQGIAKPNVAKRLSNWLLKKLDGLAGKESPKQSGASGNANVNLPQGSGVGSGSGTGSGLGLGRILGTLTAPAAAAMARLLQGERNQQIEKLLRMMKSNPDQALKYAIPLGGDGQGFRGFAIPGAALFARLTDFSLGSLFGGGGPVDVWELDFQLQSRLEQRYREQANREIAAGRFRRAAYIFAHLLSDYRAAANILVKGRFLPKRRCSIAIS